MQGLERLGSSGVLSLVIVVVVDPQEWDPFSNDVFYKSQVFKNLKNLILMNNNINLHYFHSNMFKRKIEFSWYEKTLLAWLYNFIFISNRS